MASHGYVVFAPDHAYEANITIYDDGTTAEYEGGERKRSILWGGPTEHLDFSQLSIIVDDLIFMINKLQYPEADPFLFNLPFEPFSVLFAFTSGVKYICCPYHFHFLNIA